MDLKEIVAKLNCVIRFAKFAYDYPSRQNRHAKYCYEESGHQEHICVSIRKFGSDNCQSQSENLNAHRYEH